MHTRASLVSLMAVAVLAGCPSTSQYRTADPVEPGEWRLGGAVGVGALSDREQETRIPTGQLEFHARRGIQEDLDLGGKLYLAGVEVNATWRVYKERWSIALAPSLSGLQTNENNLLPKSVHMFAQLSAIASRPLSNRWTLSLGPSSGVGLYWPETGGSAKGAWLGGFVHGEATLGTRWRLTPELSVYRTIAGEVPVRGSAIQVGVGFSRDL